MFKLNLKWLFHIDICHMMIEHFYVQHFTNIKFHDNFKGIKYKNIKRRRLFNMVNDVQHMSNSDKGIM
jgi:hypothetical protein